MHKIPSSLEGPIDRIFLAAVEKVAPLMYATGHTPNIITTYSLGLGLLAAYLLYNGNIVGFVVASIISYFMDCADGYVARKYKMTSKFGDLYDHGSDTVINIATFAAFWMRYMPYIRWTAQVVIAFAVFAVTVALMLVHLGCQQRYHNKKDDHEETLDLLRATCPVPSMIHWTRYFSCGTAKMAMVALGLYLEATVKRPQSQ